MRLATRHVRFYKICHGTIGELLPNISADSYLRFGDVTLMLPR